MGLWNRMNNVQCIPSSRRKLTKAKPPAVSWKLAIHVLLLWQPGNKVERDKSRSIFFVTTGHGVVDTSNVQLARTLIYLLVQVRCYFTFPKLKILPTCLEDFARNQNYNFLNGNIGCMFNEETVLAQPWYSDRYSRYLLFRKKKISGSCCWFVIE